jgi:hypothetical protein
MVLTSDAAVSSVFEKDTSIDPYHVVVVIPDFVSYKRSAHSLRTNRHRMASFQKAKKGAT